MLLVSLRGKVPSLCDMIEFSIGGQDLPQGMTASDGSEKGSGYSWTGGRWDWTGNPRKKTCGKSTTCCRYRMKLHSADDIRYVMRS